MVELERAMQVLDTHSPLVDVSFQDMLTIPVSELSEGGCQQDFLRHTRYYYGTTTTRKASPTIVWVQCDRGSVNCWTTPPVPPPVVVVVAAAAPAAVPDERFLLLLPWLMS